MHDPTPRQKREKLRADFARFLRALMAELDITQEALAEVCGTEQQKVGLWLNPNSPVKPQATDIALFPRELAHRVMNWLANPHDLSVVEKVVSANHGAILDHAIAVTKEGNEASAALLDALKSNDPTAWARAERELEESVRADNGALVFVRALRSKHESEMKRPRSVAPRSAAGVQ